MIKHMEQFRRQAVRIALNSGLPREQLAFDLGVGKSTLHNWIQQERFNHGTWVHGDVPYLDDVQVDIACIVDAAIDYGTHSILFGKVLAIRSSGAFASLIYGDGRFIRTVRG